MSYKQIKDIVEFKKGLFGSDKVEQV